MKKSFLLPMMFLGVFVFALPSCSGAGNKPSEDVPYEETDTYLFKDGKSSYKVVVDDELDAHGIYARDELVSLTKEATGVTLGVVTDTNLTHSATAKYISIGDNDLYQSSGLNLDLSKLKRDGYYIHSKDNSLYIVGGSTSGDLYGVYTLLHSLFNFETYTKDCYTLDKDVKEMKFRKYDYMDNPAIGMRQKRGVLYASTADHDEAMYAYRLRREDAYGNHFLPIHIGDTPSSNYDKTHNSFYFVPKEIYQAEHPKFYSDSGLQVCFTAHGDSGEYGQLVDVFAHKVEQSLTWHNPSNDPEIDAVQFGINDMASTCSCSACQAIMDRNKFEDGSTTYASVLIKFIYDVAHKVDEWMKKSENADYYRENFKYTFLAYMDTLIPPLHKSGNKYVLNDELKPYPELNVAPYVCFDKFNYAKPYYDDENEATREYLAAWGTAYPQCWAWSYGTFFNDYFCFYDQTSFYEDFYKELAKYGYDFIFEQIHDDQRGADPGFGQLGLYVTTKKSWNPELKTVDLIDAFLRNVYGNAYNAMKDIYETCKLWFQRSYIKFGWGKGITGNVITTTPSFWEKGFVFSLLKKFDDAYKAISIYQKDAALYQKYKDRIDTEWLFPAKVAVYLFKDCFTVEEYAAFKNKFKSLVEYFAIKDVKEFTSISTFMEALENLE